MYNPLPIEILLVEDNSGDVELTCEAFQEAKTVNIIHVARDGEEALDYLFKRGKYTEATRPDLVLLDLNMPRKSGQEVLAVIKNDTDLQTIPVIVLTSSKARKDVAESYNLRANAYLAKPSDLQQFQETIEAIDSFWLSNAILPNK